MTAWQVLYRKYGEDSSQYVKVFRPLSLFQIPSPLVVIIHGGFWRGKYGIEPPTACCDTLAPYFAKLGYIAAEVEYRRSTSTEWGWPHSNNDISAAYEDCCRIEGVDEQRIVVIGHSAGGTMALYLAAELGRAGPRATVALAPITNLQKGVQLELSDDGRAVIDYMHGGPSEVPWHYEKACPTHRIGDLSSLNTLIVTGTDDDEVPCSLVEEFATRLKSIASETARVDFINVSGASHYDLANAYSKAWGTIISNINILLHAA